VRAMGADKAHQEPVQWEKEQGSSCPLKAPGNRTRDTLNSPIASRRTLLKAMASRRRSMIELNECQERPTVVPPTARSRIFPVLGLGRAVTTQTPWVYFTMRLFSTNWTPGTMLASAAALL